ncbi:MAG: serine/threonine-protein kinase [Planctomycetota bacterium]
MIRSTKSSRPTEHLTREELKQLLEEAEGSSHANDALWDHLESCEICQQKLEELAGEPTWWTETREMLATDTHADGGFASGFHSSADAQAVVDAEAQPAPHPTVSVPPPEKWTRSFGEMQNREFTRDVLPILKQMPDYRDVDGSGGGDASSRESRLGMLGEYALTGVIGWGGTGVVLSAIDKSLDRSVAIKVLYPHLAARGSARRRFEREARSVASLSHPAIMPIHRVVAEAGPPYLVLAHLRGGSLQDKIDREGPLELESSLSIAMQIADALAAAHRQGVVHRDVKPGNILLEEDGHRVVLSDFGLAQTLDEMQLTASGMIAGTPPYMSPEQAAGNAVDPRSDLFSLGSVLYAMWTGREPFRRRGIAATLVAVAQAEKIPASRIRRDLPQWTTLLLDALHAKDPDDRLADAKQAKNLLEACLAHVRAPQEYPLPTRLIEAPVEQASRLPTLSKRHLAWIAGCLSVVFVLVALSFNDLFQSKRPESSSSNPSSSSLEGAPANVDAYMLWEQRTRWDDTQWDQDFFMLQQALGRLELETP